MLKNENKIFILCYFRLEKKQFRLCMPDIKQRKETFNLNDKIENFDEGEKSKLEGSGRF